MGVCGSMRGSAVAIELNFINNSNDMNKSAIVLFQKNLASVADDAPIAWKVIPDSAPGLTHRFVFPTTIDVVATDAEGAIAGPVSGWGSHYFVVGPQSAESAAAFGAAEAAAGEVQVRNALPGTSITANIFRDGRLLAVKAAVPPQQMAVFQLKPSLWVGAAAAVSEGQALDPETLSNVKTELSLLGLASADIVMSGGGGDVLATPFRFSLQNVVMA